MRFKVQGSRFKVQGSRFKVQGSRFKVQGKSLGAWCGGGKCRIVLWSNISWPMLTTPRFDTLNAPLAPPSSRLL
ncbi:MAG: hypothetical protein C0613_04005 [Desulfobulbaceae bacterium]|nr:MAG: hypothetical protein C0613_04005 [Desulfobulbaceae bacterium]